MTFSFGKLRQGRHGGRPEEEIIGALAKVDVGLGLVTLCNCSAACVIRGLAFHRLLPSWRGQRSAALNQQQTAVIGPAREKIGIEFAVPIP